MVGLAGSLVIIWMRPLIILSAGVTVTVTVAVLLRLILALSTVTVIPLS